MAPNGDKIVQALTFHRGTYVIDVAYDVTNAGAAPIAVRAAPAITTGSSWVRIAILRRC